MKKVLRVVIALVVLLALALVVLMLFLDGLVKKGVETAGPALAKVEVKLDAVKLSLLSGKGTLKGLFVGNPEGFSSPSAIKAGEVSVAVAPSSLMSDRIVVHSVKIVSPEITLHGLGADNLKKILANVEASLGTNAPAPKDGKSAEKKLQVDELLITGGKLNVILPVAGTVPASLPDIHLTNLGQGPDGITGGELAKKVLDAVLQGALGAARNVGKSAAGVVEGAGKEAGKQLEKVTKGIGDLFKK